MYFSEYVEEMFGIFFVLVTQILVWIKRFSSVYALTL